MKRIVSIAGVILICSATLVAQGRAREFLPGTLFPLNLVLDREKDIGLDEGQKKAIEASRSELDAQVRKLHETVARESAALAEILGASQIDEKRAIPAIDRILDLEKQEKRSQLLHLIRLKNTLTEGQQKALTDIRRAARQEEEL